MEGGEGVAVVAAPSIFDELRARFARAQEGVKAVQPRVGQLREVAEIRRDESENKSAQAQRLELSAAAEVEASRAAYEAARRALLYANWREAGIGWCTCCQKTRPLDELFYLSVAYLTIRDRNGVQSVSEGKRRSIVCARCCVIHRLNQSWESRSGEYSRSQIAALDETALLPPKVYRYSEGGVEHTYGPAELTPELCEAWGVPGPLEP